MGAEGFDGIEQPDLNFDDIGGMEPVKEEIRMKIIYPLKNPDLFRAYGKKAGGGVLLYGPPGCGKTLISRATAGEIEANFLSIGIHQILDLYIGESEKNLHKLFEMARDNAPAILFFDEVDALAADRRDLRKSAGRTLINQFLAEMDGNVASNDGLLILGATNAPWHIDPRFGAPVALIASFSCRRRMRRRARPSSRSWPRASRSRNSMRGRSRRRPRTFRGPT